MPIFKDPRTIIEVKGTKEYPDLVIKMASTLTAQETIELGNAKGAENIVVMLSFLIKDWNIEEGGKIMEITKENIGRFGVKTVMEILEKYTIQNNQVKKN